LRIGKGGERFLGDIGTPPNVIIGDFAKKSMLFLDFFAENHYNVSKSRKTEDNTHGSNQGNHHR
jgi:hypothetical protein